MVGNMKRAHHNFLDGMLWGPLLAFLRNRQWVFLGMAACVGCLHLLYRTVVQSTLQWDVADVCGLGYVI